VIWSPSAADDLEQIVEFIARDSERYGAQVAADVIGAVERAADFPGAGRVVPELNDTGIREVFAYNYRIIYRVATDAIHVAAIIHGARDLPTALGDRHV
jgi:toxin ParE1/3/4